jgi:hypothetical protein
MQHIHRNEKEQFKKLFEQEKADRIDDRFKIISYPYNKEQSTGGSRDGGMQTIFQLRSANRYS